MANQNNVRCSVKKKKNNLPRWPYAYERLQCKIQKSIIKQLTLLNSLITFSTIPLLNLHTINISYSLYCINNIKSNKLSLYHHFYFSMIIREAKKRARNLSMARRFLESRNLERQSNETKTNSVVVLYVLFRMFTTTVVLRIENQRGSVKCLKSELFLRDRPVARSGIVPTRSVFWPRQKARR